MNPEIATLKYSFFDADTGKPLIILYFRALKRSDLLAVWGDMGYYEKLSGLQVGETTSHIFGSDITKGIQVLGPARLQKLHVDGRFPLIEGCIVETEALPNRFARVVRRDRTMVNIEFWPAWAKGKNVRLETRLLALRPASEEEMNLPHRVSLTPIED